MGRVVRVRAEAGGESGFFLVSGARRRARRAMVTILHVTLGEDASDGGGWRLGEKHLIEDSTHVADVFPRVGAGDEALRAREPRHIPGEERHAFDKIIECDGFFLGELSNRLVVVVRVDVERTWFRSQGRLHPGSRRAAGR